MRILRIKIDDLDKRVINIGIEGENAHDRIEIDCTPMFNEYPEAVVTMFFKPPMGDAYSPEVVRDQDLVIWTLTDTDLQHSGSGEFQLKFTEGRAVALSPLRKRTLSEHFDTRQPADDRQDPVDVQTSIHSTGVLLDGYLTGTTAGDPAGAEALFTPPPVLEVGVLATGRGLPSVSASLTFLRPVVCRCVFPIHRKFSRFFTKIQRDLLFSWKIRAFFSSNGIILVFIRRSFPAARILATDALDCHQIRKRLRHLGGCLCSSWTQWTG